MINTHQRYRMSLLKLLQPFTDIDEQFNAAEMDESGIRRLSQVSNEVQAHDVFFAIQGHQTHGLRYAREAIDRQATAVVYDPDSSTNTLVPDELLRQYARRHSCWLIAVPRLIQQLGFIAAHFYDQPSQSIKVFGVTGTDGKTSVTQLLTQALSTATTHQPAESTASFGTLGRGLWQALTSATHTTDNAIALQHHLRTMVDAGAVNLVMEVSSHALHQYRVNGIEFDHAIFTNLSHDHLDYHGSLDAYAEAKARLFASPDLKTVIVNADDARHQQMLAQVKPQTTVYRYAVQAQEPLAGSIQVTARQVVLDTQGVKFELVIQAETDTQQASVQSALYGRFNIENLLAVASALHAHGLPLSAIQARLNQAKPVLGRLQHVDNNVFVDYAHTPNALKAALTALRDHGFQTITVVFGCGGDRDKDKRPMMGQVAEAQADQVILTSDNPRNEDPQQIIADIQAGMQQQVQVIVDRYAAIQAGIQTLEPQQALLIAGKGHERTQTIRNHILPFYDIEIVQRILQGTRS